MTTVANYIQRGHRDDQSHPVVATAIVVMPTALAKCEQDTFSNILSQDILTISSFYKARHEWRWWSSQAVTEEGPC